MPEDKNSKLLQTSRSSEPRKKKRKKKNKKNVTASDTAAGKKEKPLSVSLCPETSSVSLLPRPDPNRTRAKLPNPGATSKKNREHCSGSGQKTKKLPKNSQTHSHTATHKSLEKPVNELSVQDWESLRWEGVLQDPQEEAQRLELYRANRRERYIAHREALLREAQQALRQTFIKEN